MPRTGALVAERRGSAIKAEICPRPASSPTAIPRGGRRRARPPPGPPFPRAQKADRRWNATVRRRLAARSRQGELWLVLPPLRSLRRRISDPVRRPRLMTALLHSVPRGVTTRTLVAPRRRRRLPFYRAAANRCPPSLHASRLRLASSLPPRSVPRAGDFRAAPQSRRRWRCRRGLALAALRPRSHPAPSGSLRSRDGELATPRRCASPVTSPSTVERFAGVLAKKLEQT